MVSLKNGAITLLVMSQFFALSGALWIGTISRVLTVFSRFISPVATVSLFNASFINNTKAYKQSMNNISLFISE